MDDQRGTDAFHLARSLSAADILAELEHASPPITGGYPRDLVRAVEKIYPGLEHR
jgi:hypothetical protein